MKLYVMPGSCALACHIALEWANASYELEVLTHDALRSEQFLAVNPKAKVPALVLDKNDVITEAQAVLLLIADLFPDAGLAPPASDLVRRAKLNETLSELTSEAHPAFGPLFAPSRYAAEPSCEEAVKRAALTRVDACFVRLNAALEGKDWLLGERSIADPYLYVLSRWLKMTSKPVESYPAIARHYARMAQKARRKTCRLGGTLISRAFSNFVRFMHIICLAGKGKSDCKDGLGRHAITARSDGLRILHSVHLSRAQILQRF